MLRMVGHPDERPGCLILQNTIPAMELLLSRILYERIKPYVFNTYYFFEKLFCQLHLDLTFNDTPLPFSALRSDFLLFRGEKLGLGNSVGGTWSKILLDKEVLCVFLPAD